MPGSARISRRRVLAAAGGVALATTGLPGCVDGRRGAERVDPGRGGGSRDLQFLLLGPTPALLTLFNETLIPGFARQEGVKVTLQTSDWGSGFQKVVTAAASKTLPDVLTVGGIWTAPLVAKGALRPLDEYMDGWAPRSEYYPSMLKDSSSNGKVYGVPIYADVRAAAYRSDMFERAGLDPDQPPTTWAAYKEHAARLVRKKGSEIVTQGADWGLDTSIGLQQTFAQLVLQAGGGYYTSDGKANFSSAEGQQALDYLVSFYKEGLSSVDIAAKPTAPLPLVAGSSAMSFANMGVLENARTNNAKVLPHIRAGAPLAVTASAKPVTSAWINKFAISTTSKSPDAAWKWLAYISSKPNLEKLDAEYGLLPPRKDLDSASYLDDVPRHFIDASQYVVPQPGHPAMLQIAQVINTHLQRAIRLQAPPAAVLEEMDKEINRLING